jgi:sacsin
VRKEGYDSSIQAEGVLYKKNLVDLFDSVADVENMLMALQKSASNTLLFLKNIRKISVYILEPRAAEPRLAFSTEISELGNQSASRIIPEFVAGTAKSPQTKESFYNKLASIPPHLMPNAEYVVEAVTRFFARDSPEPRVMREMFAVCSLIGGEHLLKMATDPTMRHLRLVPWTGVACLIGRQESNSEKETKEVAINRNEGKVFCFLPLPVEAGLPAHVHACFELSSNRRDIPFCFIFGFYFMVFTNFFCELSHNCSFLFLF